MTTATIQRIRPTKEFSEDLPALVERISDATRTSSHGISVQEQLDAEYDRLWELRALVAKTAARSRADMIAKARLGLDELERMRSNFEIEWKAGCYADLLSSLAMDVIRLKDERLT